jgi:hypothetical protein
VHPSTIYAISCKFTLTGKHSLHDGSILYRINCAARESNITFPVLKSSGNKTEVHMALQFRKLSLTKDKG